MFNFSAVRPIKNRVANDGARPFCQNSEESLCLAEKITIFVPIQILFIMKKALMILLMALMVNIVSMATDFKTFENEMFTISYPADWEVTFYGDDWMNVATDDDEIRFDVTYNERGPMKNQLQEAVDNWVYMKESHGHQVDQKLVKDDYALVRSIETDEDDGTQTVVVWFVTITKEPEGFSGSIQSPISRANEAIDILVEMLGTLTQK